jgi:hypothetical protein
MIRRIGQGTIGFGWSDKKKTMLSFELHSGRKLSFRLSDVNNVDGLRRILGSISRFNPQDSMNNLGRFYFSFMEGNQRVRVDIKKEAMFSEIRGLAAKSSEARGILKALIEKELKYDSVSLSSPAALLAQHTLTPEQIGEFSEDVQKTIKAVMSAYIPQIVRKPEIVHPARIYGQCLKDFSAGIISRDAFNEADQQLLDIQDDILKSMGSQGSLVLSQSEKIEWHKGGATDERIVFVVFDAATPEFPAPYPSGQISFEILVSPWVATAVHKHGWLGREQGGMGYFNERPIDGNRLNYATAKNLQIIFELEERLLGALDKARSNSDTKAINDLEALIDLVLIRESATRVILGGYKV